MTRKCKGCLKRLSVITCIGLLSVYTAFAQSAGSISQYEQMARQQGISEYEIEAAKKKLGSQASQGNVKKTSQKKINVEDKIEHYDDGDFSDTLGMDAVEKNRPGFDKSDSRQKKTAFYKTDLMYDGSEYDTAQLMEEDSGVIQADSLELKYFGYDVFRNVPDAFRPNATGPVDPGYQVGPGDVMRLTVWGQAEFQYELTVNKDGKVFIPVAGQVSVTGISFEELQEKIKTLLSRSYSGMTSVPPRTYMDLTVVKQRPVRIFVMGEVKNPGGYTVPSLATAFNALYSVGGPLEGGSLRNVKIVRDGKEVSTVDMYEYLLNGTCTTDVRLQNNDVVFIPPRGKTVAVTGSVYRPAYYELRDNDKLLSLVKYFGGVMSTTNIDRAQLYRVLPFDKRNDSLPITRLTSIKLGDCILNKKDLDLFDMDSLCFTPLYTDVKNMVKLSGAVKYPGMYQSDTTTLSELIFSIGKVIEDQYFNLRADLFRLNPDLVTRSVIPISLERLRTDRTYDQVVKPGDEVVVYDRTVEKPYDLQIEVTGEVNRPGLCTLSTNMTLIDALIYAGGFNRKAYKKAVDVYRLDRTDPDTLCRVIRIKMPDSLNYLDSAARSFRLQDRDRIVVRIDPLYNEIEIVKVTGKVMFQGGYALRNRNVRLVDILERAGGLTSDAFLEGAFVIRNGKRVVVNFSKAYYENSVKDNILLKGGDSLYIPGKPNTILVYGNVNNPGLLSYVEDSRAGTYIDRAGGLADSTESILVKFPNGETRKIRKHSNGPKLPDGSSIFVTRKPFVDQSKQKQGPTIAEVIRDTLAIITSAVSILVLAVKLK